MKLRTQLYDRLLKSWPTGRGHKGSVGFTKALSLAVGCSQRMIFKMRDEGAGSDNLIRRANEAMKAGSDNLIRRANEALKDAKKH